jgi:catecholate siderophore receptor
VARPPAPTSRRQSWGAIGALVASATLGTGFVAPVSASALDRSGPHLPGPADALLGEIESSLGRWRRPADLVEAALRFERIATDEPDVAPGAAGVIPQNAVFPFAIPSGSLAVALRAFAALTGVTVEVAPELIDGLTTTGASGRMTVDQALAVLLADSRLAHRFTAASVVRVEVARREERVVVTDTLPAVISPKFTAPLLDTPQTVTVVNRKVIDAQGATNLRDILRNVPGITMQAGEGGGGLPGDTLTMRGFSASNDIFIDGVRDVGPYVRDAFNIEQVDVIKGPSSAFGGRGSTGGAINLQTKSPGLAPIRAATVALGGAEFRRTTVDVNARLAPLGANTAGRMNVLWQDAGVAGRDIVENRSWAVAPAIGFGIGTRSRLTLSYQHLKQNNVPDYGLPWGASTDAATGEVFPTGAFNATPPVDQSNFYGLAHYDFEHVANDVATMDVERDLVPGAITLRNVTRYGETTRDHAITAPRPPNRQLQRRWMHNETFANQSSLSVRAKTGAISHDVAAGLELAREDTGTANSAETTNQPSISLRHPDPTEAPFGPMPDITGNRGETRTATVGAYVFDTVDLARRVQLSGGLRWDRSDVDYRLTSRVTGDVTALGRVDRMLSGRAGVVYKPTAASSLYVGYGTSFNPASDAGTAGSALSPGDTAANNVNLDPEKTRNVEAGAKWNAFDNRLQVNGAVFDTEKTNARTRNLSSEAYVLAGRQRVRGVELGVSGEVRPGWTALASFSLLHSEVADSANAAEEGRDLALTPSRTGSVWTTWVVTRRLTIGGGAQYMDAVFRNTTTDFVVPSYWLVNAMASYAVNSHLTLRVNGTNLGDRRYPDRVGGGHYIPGPRRTIQATAALEF